MDKNIAALLRTDTKTVKVSFNLTSRDAILYEGVGIVNGKTYTYVTDLDVKAGDFVVVQAAGCLTVAEIRLVDPEVDIAPNSDTYFQWVICKVDLTSHTANAERNKQITDMVADAYRNNLRKSFAQQILSGVSPEAAAQLQDLLK